MKKKLKILFICTYNKMRSKTAELLYKYDERFEVKSAGVDEFAEVRVNLELLSWADYIVTMEEFQRQWIQASFPGLSAYRKIHCLGIPDYYDFMDPELVFLIKEKFESLVNPKINT
ncbi:MAG TPA: phosphotyrosine protein phosphatase [Candidatus Kapabacteria bacterium]|nr:phosphotyrosine protein phosphatase [Candidatus Kapabacteria bacterium]